MKDVILKAKHITKYFNTPKKFKVLDDISFSVYKGELVSIIGKSGSGKSTLLYVLSTMDTDYNGTLFYEDKKLTGQKVDDLASFRNNHIGFVFQFHYLLPYFTVLQNVMIPAEKLGIHSKEEIKERALEKLRILKMEEFANNPSEKLSGGQQQRVAIARALINDPQIIMCDEPTGNLDSKNSENVFDIFKELSQKHTQTVIMVTHEEDFAAKSDRRIELLDGKLIS